MGFDFDRVFAGRPTCSRSIPSSDDTRIVTFSKSYPCAWSRQCWTEPQYNSWIKW